MTGLRTKVGDSDSRVGRAEGGGMTMRRPAVPRPTSVRFTVDPGDVPIEKVARRLHLTAEELRARLPRLFARGFPQPDPDTGMFDLEAIDRWRHARHPRFFPELTLTPTPSEPSPAPESMRSRFREARQRGRSPEERKRNG